ncbi:hypothetical protein [Polaromonas sp.]|uniref:hypothetical protein n=1 Tax=Polaromonas sp. TaxID=1869339 RepID=UPI003263E0E0
MSGALAFLTGIATGYVDQTGREKKQKKDDEDRKLRNEAQQLQIDAAKKTVADNRNMAQAGAPIEMVEGAGGMVKPATMDNRDVGLPENAGLPNAGLNTGGYSVAGKAFTDPAAAQTELAAQNTPEARSKRVIAAMSGIDPLKALDAEQTQTDRARGTIKFNQEQEAFAKKLKDEGAIDALKSLRMGDGAGMVAAFNKGGQYKILGEPVLTQEVREIPGLGAVPTFTATFKAQGADGVVVDKTINSHDLGMRLMPYEKWLDTQMKVSKEGRESRETDSKIGLQGAQADYYRSSADAKDSAAPKAVVDRMSEVDKATLTSINKQRDTINTAMTKAQAEGTWDPASPNSKLLTTKLAALSLQESQVAGKYRETSDGTPDPLGMRKPQASAGPSSTKISPATQASRDGESLDILKQELKEAEKRAATGDTRAQGDIEGLKREIARTEKKVPANMASGGATPAARAPASAPGPVLAASAPAPAPAAAKPAAKEPADPVAAREKAITTALGVSGNGAIDKIVAAKVPAIREAADKIKAAKDELKAGAKKGDPAELKKLAQAVADARAGAEALLKDMNKPQADKVREAAGYNT